MENDRGGQAVRGQKITIDIDDVTAQGSGVGRADDGRAVFVQGALPGDRVTCELTKVKKRYANARLLSIDKKSAARTGEACPYATECGGCVFSGYDYAEQLKIKEKHVKDAFSRIGGMDDVKIDDVVGMKNLERYRNKAVFAFSGSGGDISCGFYAAGSHRVIDVEDCVIQSEPAAAAARAVRDAMAEAGVPAYDRRSRKGTVMGLAVRTSSLDGGVMAVLIVNGLDGSWKKLDLQLFADALDGAVYDAAERSGKDFSLESFYLNINKGDAPGVFGKKFEYVAGKRTLVDAIGGVKFELSPDSFFQVNHEGAEALYDAAFRYAGLSEGASMLDVYCGVGSIGLYMSKKLDDKIRVLGIESNHDAVLNANRNAVINRIVNALYREGAAEDVLPEMVENGEIGHVDAAVLDPPRAGCDEKLLDAVVKTEPDRIVYVSCDQPTAARDMAILRERGYVCRGTTVVDMFPITGRTETVSLLSK
jgi:23S rRNA (uracil1939-C5)-methyltransferase